MAKVERKHRSHIWQCRAAMVLVIIAVVFWLWFGIGSAIVEGGGWFDWLMHILIPGGIFIFSAAIAWRWGRVGGILFVVEGVFAIGLLVVTILGGRMSPTTVLLMLLTLALPPFLAGVLLLICWERRKSVGESGHERPRFEYDDT